MTLNVGDFMAKTMMAGMILREMKHGKNIWREGRYGDNHDEMVRLLFLL